MYNEWELSLNTLLFVVNSGMLGRASRVLYCHHCFDDNTVKCSIM